MHHVQYTVQRVERKTPDGGDVYYEVVEYSCPGITHTNSDLTFKTKRGAEIWIQKQLIGASHGRGQLT